MNQISRPMQIALGAAVVFAILWFLVLAPKDVVEEPAAIPATPAATTPRADAGGAAAQSGLGKTIESAKNGAAKADSAVKSRESQTGETDAATTPSAAAPSTSAAKPKPSTKPTSSSSADKAETKSSSKSNSAQDRADATIRAIKRDLEARRAVVFLIWSKAGREDKIVHRRVTKEINKRGGKVKVYLADVKDVGRYDGLIGNLGVAQTPSVIVIAPNDEAQVLGGLVSTVRIDRLTSSALLAKAAA